MQGKIRGIVFDNIDFHCIAASLLLLPYMGNSDIIFIVKRFLFAERKGGIHETDEETDVRAVS